MNTVLKLVFVRSDDKRMTLSIPHVNGNSTPAQIKAVVDAILNGNVFGDEQYNLVSLHQATIVTTGEVAI